MMTSALLTMLDTTTEDVGTLQQSEKFGIDERHFATSRLDNQFFTRPASVNKATVTPSENSSREYLNDSSFYFGQSQLFEQNNVFADNQKSDISTSMSSRMCSTFNGGGQREGQSILSQISRIQSWQGSAAAGVIHENAQFSSINPTQQLQSSPPNASTNVGLYY
jgi:hypothetical protein